ncbi:MAG: family 20 glycosylhydrolase [Clostridia bacterium]|nr:family 20 glycosylhydrolase [Clostridia bacterium]
MKNILRLTAVLMAVIMVMGTFGVSASTKLSVGSVTDGSIGPIQSGTAPVTSEEDTDLPDIGSQDTGVLPTIPELEKSVTAISRKIITPTAKLLSVPLDSTELLKIFHLDCGRKYFSVSQIEDIIDALEANGYNCLELAVGNDGLRLLLDDMSITVGGVVYSDTAVTAAIQDGNLSYYDCGDVNELTESEMDEIIAYAAARGISVIPLVNAPGHMDAILAAVNTLSGQNFAYATSTRTVDITNADAVDFTRAILSLYIEYFASKGCRVFNMGCDEYANDVYRTGSMGFGRLVSTGHYGDFINFVNSYAALVQNAGMTAMAFNDGFYFNNNVNSGTFDTDIAVAYWSSGWNFYRSMSAANLAARGHQIVNTNGDWYYVVGRTGSLGCTITKALTNIGRTPYNSVMSSGIMDVAGCMVCTWCDEPYAVYDPTEVMAQIEGFAAANSDVFAPPPPPPAPEADITVTAFETSEPYIMEGVQTVTEAGDSEIAEVILTTSGVNTGDITVSGTAADVVRDGGIYLLRSVSNTNRVLTAGMTSVSGSPRIVLSDDSDEAVLLTATRADGYTNGYYFRNSDGAYLTIGNGTAVYSDTQTVCLTASMGSVFTISDVTGTYYLNIYGGRDSYEAAGWTDGFSDIGSTWYLYEADYGQTAVTEVAFLGVTAGTTEYMIGDTIFHVTVEMAEIDCEAVIGEALVLPMRGSYQISSGYTRYATVTFADGALTINAYQPGTFTVTDKAAVYTIAVVEFDVNRVMPQTFELWQTNSPVTADGSSTAVIHASDPGVSSVAGETLKKLLPEYAVTETNGVEVIYWRSRLLMPANGEEQTTDSAVDMTNSGEALVYIRYYDRLWQYSSDRIHWADIPDGCQLVSYYMEETDLADEVHVALADWGFKSGQSWGYRPDNSVVSLSVMIVYEDGTTVPAAVDAGLTDTTLLFGLSSAARGIGTAVIIDSDEYRVWQVTAEKGSMQRTVTGQTVNVSGFAWNDNETVIWDENGDDSAYVTFEDGTVTIMNRADVPGTTAVYDNLTWNQNNDSILLRVYIRAAETEELLTVVCYDEVYGMEIPGATYHIAVPVGAEFHSLVQPLL